MEEMIVNNFWFTYTNIPEESYTLEGDDPITPSLRCHIHSMEFILYTSHMLSTSGFGTESIASWDHPGTPLVPGRQVLHGLL